jgi:hypothetical protein
MLLLLLRVPLVVLLLLLALLPTAEQQGSETGACSSASLSCLNNATTQSSCGSTAVPGDVGTCQPCSSSAPGGVGVSCGCTDPLADNFDADATNDVGSCIYGTLCSALSTCYPGTIPSACATNSACDAGAYQAMGRLSVATSPTQHAFRYANYSSIGSMASGSPDRGGAIQMEGAAHVTIFSCLFAGSAVHGSNGKGGALYFGHTPVTNGTQVINMNGSAVTIWRSTFSGNKAANGGAVYGGL